MTIGERAFQAIKARANEKGIPFQDECEALGTHSSTIRYMHWNKTNPGSWLIAEMLRQGYNIEYVLLGDEYGQRSRNCV